MSDKFPLFTKYAAEIYVKHFSESKCLVIDLLKSTQKVQLIDNGKMSSFHYDNFALGKCDKSDAEEFEEKKKQVLELILGKYL